LQPFLDYYHQNSSENDRLILKDFVVASLLLKEKQQKEKEDEGNKSQQHQHGHDKKKFMMEPELEFLVATYALLLYNDSNIRDNNSDDRLQAVGQLENLKCLLSATNVVVVHNEEKEMEQAVVLLEGEKNGGDISKAITELCGSFCMSGRATMNEIPLVEALFSQLYTKHEQTFMEAVKRYEHVELVQELKDRVVNARRSTSKLVI